MTAVALLSGVTALTLLAVHLTTVALYLRRQRRQPARLPRHIGQPPVTLLRPVCGSDPLDDETLATSFAQAYPAYRVIFCAPDDDDPCLPLLRRLVAAHPEIPAEILTGQAVRSINPKLDNLAKGWARAETDWVVMTDSNLLLPPDYLATLVASWGPGTGLVSCPAIGIRPAGFAASVECAFLNSNQARLQFAAASLGQGFAQGKTLFWNRAMLDRAGGLAALTGNIAEDVSATKLVRAEGLSVTLPPRPFGQPIGRRRIAQVWERQLRWSRIRRDGFPLIFLAEIANGATLALACAALALAATGTPLAWLAAFAALWYGAEIWLMRRAGWPCGPRDIAALPVRDAMMPALWLATFFRRGFEWRGTAVEDESRIAG